MMVRLGGGPLWKIKLTVCVCVGIADLASTRLVLLDLDGGNQLMAGAIGLAGHKAHRLHLGLELIGETTNRGLGSTAEASEHNHQQS